MGLALALGAVSKLGGLIHPSHTVALAAVDDHGQTRPVGSIVDQATFLSEWALSVKRLLVSAKQPEDEQNALRSLGFEVVETETIGDAVEETWTELKAKGIRWDDERAHQVLEEMLSIVSNGLSRGVTWGGLERTAESLGTFFPEGSEERRNAMYCVYMANHHDGDPRPLDEREHEPRSLAKLPRPIRLDRWTTFVRSYEAARDPEDVRRALEAAHEQLMPRSERGASDFRLLAAMGRTAAVAGMLEQARTWLELSILGWLEIRDFERAQPALTEWLRVAALSSERDGFEQALSSWVPRVERSLFDPVDRATLALSEARSWVLFEEADKALEVFDEIDDERDPGLPFDPWGEVPRLEASQLRWRARAHDLNGQSERAAELRQRISHVRGSRELPMIAALARLDEALEDPSSTLQGFDSELWRCKKCLPLYEDTPPTRASLTLLANRYPF